MARSSSLSRSRSSFIPSKRATKRSLLSRAIAAGFERLENRQHFSATLNISGAPSPVNEGATYSLNLAVSGLSSQTVSQYSINWGDGGPAQTISSSANPLVVTHAYPDGPALNLNVTATATLSDSEVLQSNVGSTTVTSDGTPDADFGAAGVVTTTFAPRRQVTNSVLELANGQLLAAGLNGSSLSLVRYSDKGVVDPTFTTPAVPELQNVTGVGRIMVQLDTSTNKLKYVVAGSTSVSIFSDGVVWRFNDDGSLDTTFGGTGMVTLSRSFVGGTASDSVTDATIDANGKIVTVGTAWPNTSDPSSKAVVAVARLNNNGTPDTTFGANGEQSYAFGIFDAFFNTTVTSDGTTAGGIAAMPDGSVAVVADGETDAGRLSHLLNFSDGAAPSDVTVSPAGNVHFDAIAADGSGKLILGGGSGGPGNAIFELARYSNATTLDTSFGSGGFVTTGTTGGTGVMHVTVGGDGKIVAAGATSTGGTQVTLARYSGAGVIDSSFGASGVVKLGDPGDVSFAQAVVVQTDTKVLVHIADTSLSPSGNVIERLGNSSGSASTPVTVTVDNVNPITAAITTPAKAVRYQSASFASSFTDPGILDTHTVTWNFGDSSPAATSSLGAGMTGAVSASHVFTTAGTFTITLTVTDKDGGSGVSTKSFTVDVVDIQTDPNDPSKTALFIGGSGGDDAITVNPGSNPGIQAIVNSDVFTHLQPTGRIVIFGGDGNDVIQVAGGITLNTEIYGGNGNDLIKGGNGNNLIVGGAGEDLLVGGNGRDILIGGAGNDVLVTGSGEDVLIAMSTAYDANATALEAMQNEWSRSDLNFAGRVNHLLHGGGLNGTVVVSSLTTVNDGAVDLLSGGGGSDLFVVSGDITDAGHSDTVVNLSWVTV